MSAVKSKKSSHLSICRQALQITRDIATTTSDTILPNCQGMTAGRYAMLKVFASRNGSIEFIDLPHCTKLNL